MLFELAYEARAAEGADPCPDRGAFVAAVRARSPRVELVDERPDAIHLRVTIDATTTGASGVVDVRDPDGSEERRTVSGRTCVEVANGLALVVALVLDPDASTADASAPPASDPAPPPAPSPAPPAPPAPPPSSSAPPTRAKPAPGPREPRRPHWHAYGGGAIGVTGGIGPGLAPTIGAFVDVALDTPSAFAPAFRLGIDVGGTSDDLPSGGRSSQSYVWAAARARACPVWLSWSRPRLRLGPCAGMHVGWHRGATSDVPNASTSSDTWLSPTLGGALEWAVSPAVTLELGAHALFPLRRSRFFLAPSTTLYAVPEIAGAATIGARLRFL